MQHSTQRLSALAPRPATLADLGLAQTLLADLLAKHLAEAGALDMAALGQRLGLSASLVEALADWMRGDGRVEVLGMQGSSPFLRVGLTERGRRTAAEAFGRDGYVGPAPVPLADYRRVVSAQSGREAPLRRQRVHEAFADTVIEPALLDRLGPAVNSGRAIFIYGPAGTGKSFIARRLSRLLGPPVLVPHAIAIGDSTVRCFDPAVHRPLQSAADASALLREGFDGRYVLCERPMVVAGGELTQHMLDLGYDAANRLYQPPLQLRANNGLLLLDDLGRQRISPTALFNRWIIPLEERQDHLTLKGGQQFIVPFDLVLVLSTNLDPLSLADQAFLRRIGYKVPFAPATPQAYTAIYRQECERSGIDFQPAQVRFLIDQLHARHRVDLLPCHPRDLLGLALDRARYLGEAGIDESALRWAWDNYFVTPAALDQSTAHNAHGR